MHRSIDSRGASLALILAAACWGTGTVVSKAAVAEFPPLTLLAIQLAASLVFRTAAVFRWAVAAGTIASRNGNATVAPSPRRTVRRERCFLVMNMPVLQ